MVDQRNLDTMYMEMAYAAAKRSYARRRKVGAILVTPDEGRFEGINGMPSKFDNNCENEEYRIDGNHDNYSESEEWVLRFCTPQPDGTWLTPRHNVVRKHLVTKLEVLHAESNAIMKVARSHASSIGGTIYCTLSPCLECAKLIIQAGITRVVYAEQYPYPGHSGPVRDNGS
jgi:dCMP deaminase